MSFLHGSRYADDRIILIIIKLLLLKETYQTTLDINFYLKQIVYLTRQKFVKRSQTSWVFHSIPVIIVLRVAMLTMMVHILASTMGLVETKIQ